MPTLADFIEGLAILAKYAPGGLGLDTRGFVGTDGVNILADVNMGEVPGDSPDALRLADLGWSRRLSDHGDWAFPGYHLDCYDCWVPGVASGKDA